MLKERSTGISRRRPQYDSTNLARWCRRLCRGCLCAGLSLVTASVAARAQAPTSTTGPSWTEPVDLPGMPPGRLQRWPILSAVHDTVFVAANIYPIEGTLIGDRPIYLARVPGGSIPAPPGHFQFVYPEILATPNGRVHLVWAEFDSAHADALNWAAGLKTVLWHATLAGGTWSTPEVIYRASAIEWTKRAGHLAIDSSGALHVVVWSWGSPSTPRSGVVHLREGPTAWTAEAVPSAPFSRETAVEAVGDSVLVAFVATSFTPSDTSVVHVVVSLDHGATWPTSTVVHQLAGRNADHLQFIRTGTTTYLVWSETPTRGFSRDTLRVLRLEGGLRPVPVAAVPLPDGASTFSVTATPCGDLDFLIGTLSLSPQTFDVIVTAGGTIERRSLHPPDDLGAFAGIGATSRTLVAVFAMQSHPEAPARAVVTKRLACAARR